MEFHLEPGLAEAQLALEGEHPDFGAVTLTTSGMWRKPLE